MHIYIQYICTYYSFIIIYIGISGAEASTRKHACNPNTIYLYIYRYIYIRTYVCMYVCMYIYICMYVCN